ncbi:MAG: GNAT family N-acetyltransferase [Solirubrobacteraceae bacterium]|jgi:predicted GNAT superfamily acetyltransferase
MRLRELTREDWPALLALNQASVLELSELDERRLEFILSLAHRSLAVENKAELVAFAVAIAPGTPYDSRNYRWFGARYERFLYLDRIVVAAPMRRRGIGAQIYEAMEATAASFERMVCDVNVLPANEVSLAFHAARGYGEIGRLSHGPEKVVALLSKELERSGRSRRACARARTIQAEK